MTQPAPINEAEALQAVEAARASLALALDTLRIARGQPHDEECRACGGTGKDPLSGLMSASTEEQACDSCAGTGRTKKAFPLIVTNLKMTGSALQPSLFKPQATWVSVRPCDEALKGKTFLGWLLGEIASGLYAQMSADGTLQVSMGYHNPAIFVPELGKVVFGYESWWAAINSPDDLRRISDTDINNVWYVRALRDLESAAASKQQASSPNAVSE